MSKNTRKSVREILENLSGNIQDKYLIFSVEEWLFGIPLVDILRITGPLEMTEIPDCPPVIKGVTSLRGGIILPLVDMRVCLKKGETAYHDRICILITSIRGQKVGLIADGVKKVLNIPKSRIFGHEALSLSPSEGAFLRGAVRTSRQIILLLDVEKLLNIQDLKEITACLASHT